jgi:hypothetical protein
MRSNDVLLHDTRWQMAAIHCEFAATPEYDRLLIRFILALLAEAAELAHVDGGDRLAVL